MFRRLAPFPVVAFVAFVAACGASPTVPDPALTSAPAAAPQTFAVYAEPVLPNSRVTVSVGLVAPDGMTLTDAFPFRLRVTGPPGAEPASIELGARDAVALDATSITFDVPCSVGPAGTYPFSATLHYSVCTPTSCRAAEADVSWVLVAQ